jgi:hypothetical protein
VSLSFSSSDFLKDSIMAIRKYIVRAGFSYRTKDEKGVESAYSEGDTLDLTEEEGGAIHLLELADPKARDKAATAEAAAAKAEAARAERKAAEELAAAEAEAARKAAEELANAGNGKS